VNLYVGVTDNDWFSFHLAHRPDEVNFWRPGGEARFRALNEGEPFLFKLRSPENAIAGGGFFVSYTSLSLSMAWKIFEDKNGFSGFAPFRSKILAIKGNPDLPGSDPMVGCIVLAIPFFFPRALWIPPPADWSRSTQQGKIYDADSGIGKDLWRGVMDRLPQIPSYLDLGPEIRKKGTLYVVEARQGQSAFRAKVLDAYSRRCAMTGERTEPALEASHIRPYNESGPNRVDNGLLLRADLHQIFDAGYITVTSSYKIEVSKQIKEEFENGKDYYKLHGQTLLTLPDRLQDHPSAAYIAWHNQFVFRG
jgi:putative restriction endonuclease